jgi:sugar phosphate isomerase/epimerase
MTRTGHWWGTIEGAGLLELVEVAAAAGFTDISVMPAMYFAARGEGHSDDDLRARLADHGIAARVVDPLIRGLPGSRPIEQIGERFRAAFAHDEDDCYRVADALGARSLNVAHYLGEATPLEALIDAAGAICARAATHGIEVLVEFMPEGSIPDLATAAAVVAAVGAANCGVMLDTWHFWRTGAGTDVLRALPPGTIRGLQLSDALADVRGTGTEPPTRDRLLPGVGVIPLAEIVAIARANHTAVALGLEVFNHDLRRLPAVERARRSAAALDDLLGSRPPEP